MMLLLGVLIKIEICDKNEFESIERYFRYYFIFFNVVFVFVGGIYWFEFFKE